MLYEKSSRAPTSRSTVMTRNAVSLCDLLIGPGAIAVLTVVGPVTRTSGINYVVEAVDPW